MNARDDIILHWDGTVILPSTIKHYRARRLPGGAGFIVEAVYWLDDDRAFYFDREAQAWEWAQYLDRTFPAI